MPKPALYFATVTHQPPAVIGRIIRPKPLITAQDERESLVLAILDATGVEDPAAQASYVWLAAQQLAVVHQFELTKMFPASIEAWEAFTPSRLDLLRAWDVLRTIGAVPAPVQFRLLRLAFTRGYFKAGV